MYKLTSVALSAALGIAGVSHSVPAEAHPYVSVGIALPGVAVVEPSYAPGYYVPYYYAPYYYAHGRYWHRDYDRDRYEHFHRHWDHR